MTSPRRIVWLVAVGGLLAALAGWLWSLSARPTPQPSDHPAGLPDARFTDVTGPAGIRFTHTNGAAGRKLLPETMGAGVAVLDYDRDGRPDLLFVNGRPWPGDPAPAGRPPTLALYRNKGDGTFEEATAAAGLAVTLYGMGVAVGDYDNDGWPDVFVTAVGGDRLFHNEPGPAGRRFADVTAAAGLGGETLPDVPAAAFARWDRPIPFPSSATWVDYDGDGRLDLFVCRYVTWSPALDLGVDATLPGGVRAYVPPTQFPGDYCRLLRNVGGRFEDVSAAAGVRVADPVGPGGTPGPTAKALGVVVCDPDGDGWPDLLVANDTVRNFFFHNEPGPDGSRVYKEVGYRAGAAYADEGRPRGGMGVDYAEIRPGVPAAVVANFTDEPNTLLTLAQANPVRFRDEAAAVGVAGPSRVLMKFGAFFFDYDLDGRNDLLTVNGHLEPDIAAARPNQTYRQPAQLFRNTGRPDRLFELVPAADAGPDLYRPMVGRGAAYVDYDGDGDLDVVLTENGGPARLLRNDNRTANRWVRLVLVGNGRESSRDAVGAKVVVEVAGQTYRRSVAGARGYLSQSEATITVGLGGAEVVDRVTVRWPGRAAGVERWEGLAVGREHVLEQGKGNAGQR